MQVVTDGMDVLGGAGICNGPNNFLANAYCSVPIAITVEGANILTRSLIQFGQGLTRSHPHLRNLIESIQHGDDMKGFNQNLAKIIGHAVTNVGYSLSATVTRQRIKGSDPIAYYESQLSKLATNFALCSDFALTLGGGLKAAEFTSGRFADVLSNIFLGYAVLWHYKKFPVQGADKMVDYAMQSILFEAEDALHSVFNNFPIPGVGLLMRGLTFPTGRCYSRPDDKTIKAVARLISTDSEVRKQFKEGIFISNDANDRVGLINQTLPKAIAADAILAKCRKEKRQPNAAEQTVIDAAEAAREIIIQVDSFARIGQEISKPEEWTYANRPSYGAAAREAVGSRVAEPAYAGASSR